ncbi:MAG: hypothetical protein HOV80_20185 [Polyangiaceae bacterium]|nr:hypothetical protein [Polyangiaceae bacterium]
MSIELKVVRSFVVELDEMSGLAVREGDEGPEVLAIGDSSYNLAIAPVARPDAKKLGKPYAKLGKLLGEKGASQWEAVTTDGAGNVYILEETPGGVLGFPQSLDSFLGRIDLEVDDDSLVPGWGKQKNSRGEGLILLENGRILVAKEKGPPMLVEFAPQGAEAAGVSADLLNPKVFSFHAGTTFYACASWSLEGVVEDVSDISSTRDGRLFAISDKSREILRIDLPLVPGEPLRVVDRRLLPSVVNKAEGLIILPDGRAVVGSDEAQGEENLFIVE